MANILLVDPADIARKAMKGVLARGGHRFAAVATVADAWEFIQRNLRVDLIFLELKWDGEDGLTLVQRLRGDPCLKTLPVVIYTAAGDRDAVRRAMALKVQNFLVKPYADGAILGEVAKVVADPWIDRQFEEEKSFCKMMGYTPEALRKMLDELRRALETAPATLLDFASRQHVSGAVGCIDALATQAEACGAWGVVELLGELRNQAAQGSWSAVQEAGVNLGFAARVIGAHLDRGIVPEGFITDEERDAAAEAARRAVWFNAPAEGRCPVVQWPQLAKELDGLSGCPVIDSVAAAFQMAATGHPSSLAPLMDLAEKDPGLSAHLLVAANRMRRHDDIDPEPVENARICVSLLGEIKLAAMASGLIAADTRMMHLPPCTWTNHWMFQMGVARMARYTCRYLEFNSLESRAYAAGLLHDIGKMLLVYLHPYGFQAVLECARAENLPLAEAERKFLGCTTREMAAYFAEKHGLLPSYVHVMRWVETPEEAKEEPVLVASVALARDLCRQNRLGWSGDMTRIDSRPLADTPAWRILSRSIFPSFNLEKFEAEAHAECREIKRELQGKVATSVR